MNARAQRRRAERNTTEWALQAHDALHKGDEEACHLALHRALGLDTSEELLVQPLTDGSPFDREFVDLCRRHNVRAAYVAAGAEVEEKGTRLITGGEANMCAFLDQRLRAGA